MNIKERAEIELGIQNIDALTSPSHRLYESAQPFPKSELEGAQKAFAEAFEETPGLTQIDPNKFFIATVKDGIVKREYYRPSSDGDEAFKFVPQASCKVGHIQGKFGVNMEWRQNANFRRDSLTFFPFDDEMKLRLNPGDELSIDWKKGLVSKIKLLTKLLEEGKVNTHHSFTTHNAYEEALQGGNVRFLSDHFSIGRFQRAVDLDYLRADEAKRDEIDSLMNCLVKNIGPTDFSRAYASINMLHLEKDKENGEAIVIEKVGADTDETDAESGIVVKRFESPEQEGILDDIFIPEPFDPLVLAASIFPKEMLLNPESAPLEFDKNWLNYHSIVRELIGLKWARMNPDLRRKSF